MTASERAFLERLRKIPEELGSAAQEVRYFAKEWPLAATAAAMGTGFLVGSLVSRIFKRWS